MAYVDALGQNICRCDTVTLLSPASSSAAAASDGDRCGVVLGKARHGCNKLLVRRLDGSWTTVNATDVRIADRSYMQPSMTVASSADDIDAQLGLVMCAATELDLARLPSPPADGNGHDENSAPAAVVARAVSPAEVRHAGGELSVGDYVVSAAAGAGGAWLGCVLEVYLDVDVVFDDGAAMCRIPWWRTARLWTTTTARVYPMNASNSKEFYQGQRVRGPPGVLKASRWLKGYWKPNHGQGTVSRVETKCVLVYWLASSSSQMEAAASAPANLQSPRDLTFFYAGRVSDYPYWIAGNRCFFRRGAPPASAGAASDDQDPQQSSSDTAAACGELTTRRTTAAHRDWQKLWRQWRRPSRRQRSLHDDLAEGRPLAVASTRTTVDVVWQDGTRQHGVPSTSLVLVCSDGTVDVSGAVHELFPGQHVVRRMPETTEPPEECVGVVRGYSYKEQTVCVSWPESDEDETLSAYDVSRVYSPCYGDIVVRRRQLVPTTDDSPASTGTSASAANDLSWVGVYCDRDCDEAEYIYVKWGDGNTSKVLFREITIITERSIDDLHHELGEWWVDEDRDVINTIDSGEDDENSASEDSGDDSGSESDYSSGSESGSEDNGSTLMTRMNNRIGGILQAVIQLAGKVFAQGRMYLKIGFRGAEASRTELTATESMNVSTHVVGDDGDVKNISTAKAGINGGGGDDGDTSTREDNKMEAHTTAGYEDEPFHFPQFEMAQQSPSDHHYLDSVNEQGTDVGRKWTKRVQKEWKILENNLPDTIYVRVFEDRMDLLRAVMVGASGTPYHDGLFFFDLQLPSSYPTEPPLVNYRSYGVDVNPNLYPSGTVCLSLLNTYGGQHEAELWLPESSTVLQVVVSIQGLVLTTQPYYNEPAWAQAGTPMGQRNELPYRESAFLQSLQTMLHVIRRPPAGFEEFVGDHFRRRGQRVIRACEAYRDGCLVGTLDEEGHPTEDSKKRPCSAGFRLALLNVLPRLVEAFGSIDAQGC